MSNDSNHSRRPGKRERRKAREAAELVEARASETLDELLARLGIADDDWDWLLFGDGSGSNYRRGSAWATVSIERVTMDRQVWVGAMNRGTVNMAEMLAYLQPLTWIVNQEHERVEQGQPRRAVRVHIVTDSDYCRQKGETPGDLVAKNAGLWAAFGSLRRDGVVLTWHHINREDAALNSFCDRLSKIARRLVESYNWSEGNVEDGRTRYDFNPD